MPYYRCFYHVIWATKYRQPVITPTYELIIFPAIQDKAVEKKCQVLEINTAFDHLHIALSMPPSIALADVIGQLKGASSHAINTSLTLSERFYWQEGYGVLTFGEKALPQLLDYIRNQKQHHANGTTSNYLETIED